MATITKADRRAYVRKLQQIERRFGRLERDTLLRSITMLRDFRGRVAGQLSDVENFEQFRLRELQRNLDETITGYEGQLRSLSNGSIRGSANLGASSIVEPLESAGITNLFFRASPAQINVLLDFSADLITGIGHEMRKRINNQISISALGEQSSFQAMREITKMLGIPKKATDPAKGIAYEAERILRTETNRAYNLAAHSQQKDIAEQVDGLEKQWIATGDSRTRLSHLIAHGQVVPVDKQFIVGGSKMMFPGDPAGSPQETINCRCRSILVIPEIGVLETPLDKEIEAEREKRGRAEKAKVEKKAALARRRFTIADEIALIEKGAIDPFATIRPPAGRAPRGLGTEYAQRRRIVSRIETQMKYRGIAEEKLSKYRGQTGTRARWRIDVAKERVRELNKSVTTMIDIAGDPITDDWAFKGELVDGIIEYTSAMGVAAA